MTTSGAGVGTFERSVVEAYRLDRYDNPLSWLLGSPLPVVEAYRLDRYDNSLNFHSPLRRYVVEAYRLDRYDNFSEKTIPAIYGCCRSLSFG